MSRLENDELAVSAEAPAPIIEPAGADENVARKWRQFEEARKIAKISESNSL
tara:strand:- start:47 stop:202 length:156 start_codon:yes stop_codon:yes gene_type:complete